MCASLTSTAVQAKHWWKLRPDLEPEHEEGVVAELLWRRYGRSNEALTAVGGEISTIVGPDELCEMWVRSEHDVLPDYVATGVAVAALAPELVSHA
jgi:hypothetical protein